MSEIDDALEFGRKQKAEQESLANAAREQRKVVDGYLHARDQLSQFSDYKAGEAALANFIAAAKPLNLESKIAIAISGMQAKHRDSYQCAAALLKIAMDGFKRGKITAELKKIDGEAGLLERVKTVFCEVQGDLSPFHPITGEIDTPNVRARLKRESLIEHIQSEEKKEKTRIWLEKRRPCFNRDHTFLKWKKEGLTPARSRDRWNKEHPGDSVGEGPAGREVVKSGIKAAQRDLKKDKGGD